jgi:hypothetical protein
VSVVLFLFGVLGAQGCFHSDPEAQQKLQAKWPNAVLKMALDEGLETHMMDFVDGDLTLVLLPSSLGNVDSVGADLAEVLNN